MPTRKKPTDETSGAGASANQPAAKNALAATSNSSAHATVSGPSVSDGVGAVDVLSSKMAATQALVNAIAFNPAKPGEYGAAAVDPQPGVAIESPAVITTASTVTETVQSSKVGTRAKLGDSPGTQSLDRVRTDGNGQRLTTNLGVPVADNQNSLKAGLRGPALLEDFILREKITHFDHERIPERVVHARGSPSAQARTCWTALRFRRPLPSGAPDPGLLIYREKTDEAVSAFVKAVARHRHHERELDPPEV